MPSKASERESGSAAEIVRYVPTTRDAEVGAAAIALNQLKDMTSIVQISFFELLNGRFIASATANFRTSTIWWLLIARTDFRNRNWLPRSECTMPPATVAPAARRIATALDSAVTASQDFIREAME